MTVLCRNWGSRYELYVAQGLDPRRLIYPSEAATTLGGASKKDASRKEKAVKAGAQHAVALRLLLSGNVDIILGHLSRVSRQYSTLQALWGVLYLVLTLIGHWVVLVIRCCVQTGAAGSGSARRSS